MKPYLLLFMLILIIGFVGVFSSIWIKRPFDDISKRESATKRLDAYSLSILATMSGLTYDGRNLDNFGLLALRNLISLELIELDAFPVRPGMVTSGYYLTDLGRYILKEKLNKKELFPPEFCEMIRVWYWRQTGDVFDKNNFKRKQGNFYNKFGVSWNDDWVVFDGIIRKIKPNQPEDDAMTIFLAYLPNKTYEVVMKDLVTPWLEEVNKKGSIMREFKSFINKL